METEAPGQATLDEAADAHVTSNDVGDQTATKADEAAGADEAEDGEATDEGTASTAEPEEV